MNLTYMYFIPPGIDLIVSLITYNAVECHIIRGGPGGSFRGGGVRVNVRMAGNVRIIKSPGRVPGGSSGAGGCVMLA